MIRVVVYHEGPEKERAERIAKSLVVGHEAVSSRVVPMPIEGQELRSSDEVAAAINCLDRELDRAKPMRALSEDGQQRYYLESVRCRANIVQLSPSKQFVPDVPTFARTGDRIYLLRSSPVVSLGGQTSFSSAAPVVADAESKKEENP